MIRAVAAVAMDAMTNLRLASSSVLGRAALVVLFGLGRLRSALRRRSGAGEVELVGGDDLVPLLDPSGARLVEYVHARVSGYSPTFPGREALEHFVEQRVGLPTIALG